MSDQYRIEPVAGGFEAQMLYSVGGIPGRSEWFPLTADGYWSDPSAFSFGLTCRRDVLTRAEAMRAIARARAINNEGRTP
jgi:hypothetical protein